MRRILPFSFQRPMAIAIGLAVLVASSSIVWAQGTADWGKSPPASGIIREPLIVEYSVKGEKVRLEAVITRPAAPGRFPMVVISHGSPRDAAERPTMNPNGTSHVAVDFARRGWIAISPMRRGYGKSSGDYVESGGSCNDPDYHRAGLVSGQDVLAAAEALRANPHADPDRLLLIGVSAGGFASVSAASSMPRGLVGVINFAGGRGSSGPDHVCSPQRLVEAMDAFGRTVRAPALWIYSENDHFFGPDLARRMFAAYTRSGAPGTFIKAPPYKEDGHFLFSEPEVWNGWVDKFLRAQKLPTWKAPIVARTSNLPAPPGSGTIVKGFERFLELPHYAKAFAIGKDGAWGRHYSSHRDDAIKQAIESCAEHGAGCHLYALDDTLAK